MVALPHTHRHETKPAPGPAPGEYELPEAWRTGAAFSIGGRPQVCTGVLHGCTGELHGWIGMGHLYGRRCMGCLRCWGRTATEAKWPPFLSLCPLIYILAPPVTPLGARGRGLPWSRALPQGGRGGSVCPLVLHRPAAT